MLSQKGIVIMRTLIEEEIAHIGSVRNSGEPDTIVKAYFTSLSEIESTLKKLEDPTVKV